jgi:antirestriction protein ArdC
MTSTAPRKRRQYDGPTSEEVLVNNLIELMESSDLPPWRRPWSAVSGSHRNLLTGHEYRGSNPILLEIASLCGGHHLPLWLGASQAKQRGWFPKKGTKAARIVRPQLNSREEENPQTGEKELKSWVSYKIVCVFNVNDLQGADDASRDSLAAAILSQLDGQLVPEAAERHDRAEACLSTWDVTTTWGGQKAYYLRSSDTIHMPARETFLDREACYSTWAHETAHSTGHESRLARTFGVVGEPEYAREELVAELACVLICYRLQVGTEMQDHASYLKAWAGMLRDGGARVLFKVLTDARRAADLICPEEAQEETAEG